MKNKIRLIDYLVERGLSESPEKAKSELVTGWIKVNGETVREPGKIITGSEAVSVARPGGEYVSRGGYKLQHALSYFQISVNNMIIADIGASTGGFTDCMLQNGASRVYCIDVGYGILAHKLRTDPRVIIKERTNVKNLTVKDFHDKVGFITIDLSFISVLKVADKLKELFRPAEGIMLIKPQFEAEKDEHEKGVVKNKAVHVKILTRVVEALNISGIISNGLHYSPIKGPAGNIEFLLYFKIESGPGPGMPVKEIYQLINSVVHEAHKVLNTA